MYCSPFCPATIIDKILEPMPLIAYLVYFFFFFSSRRRHTRYWRDWSSDVCSSDLRNYGEWANEQYDALIDAQAKESDPAKRLKLVQDAQRALADDLYITQFGWGPAVIEAYNSAAWDDVVETRGFGIGSFNAFHTFLRAKPKTSRPRLVVGMQALLETSHIIAARHNMRSIRRMIY